MKAQSKSYALRCGIAITPEQHAEFVQIISNLMTNIPAHFVLLVDVDGQVILAKGEHDQENLVMLSSLVAGDLAASQEIARLTGQFDDYQTILREGEQFNSFIVEAGAYLALFAQVNHDVPLGWARMLIKQAGQQLVEVVKTSEVVAATSPEFSFEVDDNEFSDLFCDAIDDMWKDL